MSRKLIELMRVFSVNTPVVTPVAVSESGDLETMRRELRDIKSENEDLTSAYEMTQQELDSLREKARDMELDSERRSVVNLLKQMNSSESGNVLDSIAQTDKQIKVLKSGGWEPPVETEGAVIAIRLMSNFLKKFGICPMEEIGAKLELNLRQSELYEYAGSEFVDEKEIKKVEIKAPGWTFQKEIISRPRIQECF